MYVIFTDITGDLLYILPVIPSEIKIKTGASNETIDTLSGFVRLIGAKNLKEISWKCFFPVNKAYPFQIISSTLNGWTYVNFFEQAEKDELPVRLIITATKKSGILKRTVINTLVSIDNFEYTTDKVGDINYSLSMTEFPSDKWNYINSKLKNSHSVLNNNEQDNAARRLKENGLV